MCDFTDAELEQQDYVDNAIYDLLQNLCGETEKLDWDIEIIADVREVIGEYFEEQGIMSEQEFYPYRKLTDPYRVPIETIENSGYLVGHSITSQGYTYEVAEVVSFETYFSYDTTPPVRDVMYVQFKDPSGALHYWKSPEDGGYITFVPRDVMPKVGGVSFRCPGITRHCGGNVFTEYKRLHYQCNSCGARYAGELLDQEQGE